MAQFTTLHDSKYETAVASYLQNAQADSYSPATLENMSRVLALYGEHLRRTQRPPDSVETIVSWKEYLSAQQGDKSTTIRYYLTILSGFFSYCVTLGLYSRDPVLPTLKPRRPRNNAPYQNLLTAVEIEQLLSPVRPSGATRRTWARNYAIVVLFLTTAIRNSELRALTPLDLDWKNGIITVEHGKGDKYRAVPFPRIAQRAVRAYLDSPAKEGGRPEYASPTAPLFGIERQATPQSAPQWRPLERVDLSETVRRHVKIVTGRDNIRSHALRHSSSSYMWAQGVSADDLSGVLGHSDLKTTQVYLDRLHPSAPALSGASVFDRRFA